MLNTDPLNSRALGAAQPPEGGIDCIPIIKQLPGSVLNGSPLGSWALNGSGGTIVIGCDDDPQGALFDPLEQVEVYLLQIGELRVPMSSFQATVRLRNKSFLQVIVPNGGDYLESMKYGELMSVQMGHYYPSKDEFGALKTIAQAPIEQIRSDQGATRYTVTLAGYDDFTPPKPKEIALEGVQTRSVDQGVRRVRANMNIDLRPNHLAVDSDGTVFGVGQIQYFVNSLSSGMEVLEGAVLSAITLTFASNDWQEFISGSWFVDEDEQSLRSMNASPNQSATNESMMRMPFNSRISMQVKQIGPPTGELFEVLVNDKVLVSSTAFYSSSGISYGSVAFQANKDDVVTLRHTSTSGSGNTRLGVYISSIRLVPYYG